MANYIEFETEDAYNEAINKAIEEKNQGWISERLQTARNKAIEETQAQYSDYEELKSNVQKFKEKEDSFSLQIEELKTQAAASKSVELKLRAAIKYGIPIDMADRIAGTSEEEINSDAEKLSKFVSIDAGTPKPAPLKNPSAEEAIDGVTAAFMKMNPNIKL